MSRQNPYEGAFSKVPNACPVCGKIKMVAYADTKGLCSKQCRKIYENRSLSDQYHLDKNAKLEQAIKKASADGMTYGQMKALEYLKEQRSILTAEDIERSKQKMPPKPYTEKEIIAGLKAGDTKMGMTARLHLKMMTVSDPSKGYWKAISKVLEEHEELEIPEWMPFSTKLLLQEKRAKVEAVQDDIAEALAEPDFNIVTEQTAEQVAEATEMTFETDETVQTINESEESIKTITGGNNMEITITEALTITAFIEKYFMQAIKEGDYSMDEIADITSVWRKLGANESERYLKTLETMAIAIEQKEDTVAELKERIYSISSPATDSERVSASVVNFDKTGAKIAMLADLCNTLNDSINAYYVTRNRIIDEIVGIPNPVHVQFLLLRYVSFMSLKDISDRMNYSYERIRHLHVEALESFEKVMSTHNSTSDDDISILSE